MAKTLILGKTPILYQISGDTYDAYMLAKVGIVASSTIGISHLKLEVSPGGSSCGFVSNRIS